MKRFRVQSLSMLTLTQLIIFSFGCLILFWRIGGVPHGMTVDEAAIGYNGYSVVRTFRDEWLDVLPVSFRSFGDYKAPLAIYINGIFTVILGLKLWVIRLPFVLSGVLAVIGMSFLCRQLYRYHHPTSSWVWWSPASAGLVGSGLLITTPWFIHFARTGFEAGMALMFVIWAVATSISYLNQTTKTRSGWLWLSVILFVCSMYTYHSAKVVVPLLVLLLLVTHWRRAKKKLPQLGWAAGMMMSLLAPMAYNIILGEGGTRFNQATLFHDAENLSEQVQTVLLNIGAHLNPRFLVGGLTTTLRHGDGQWGVLLPLAFGLVLAGGWSYYFWRHNYGTRNLWLIAIGWIAIGLVPAILGSEVPHANRALLALPGVILLQLLGIEYLGTWVAFWRTNRRIRGSHREKDSVLKAIMGTLLLIHVLTFVAYQQHYYTAFAANSASDYLDGYLDTFKYIIPYEKGTAGQEVERILFTDRYSQPYIYALLARRTLPRNYWGGSLIKYQFVRFENTSALLRPNTLVVTAPEDGFPIEEATKVIYGSDGRPRFIIFVNETAETE